MHSLVHSLVPGQPGAQPKRPALTGGPDDYVSHLVDQHAVAGALVQEPDPGGGGERGISEVGGVRHFGEAAQDTMHTLEQTGGTAHASRQAGPLQQKLPPQTQPRPPCSCPPTLAALVTRSSLLMMCQVSGTAALYSRANAWLPTRGCRRGGEGGGGGRCRSE